MKKNVKKTRCRHEKNLSTGNLSTRDHRITIKLHENTELAKKICVDNDEIKPNISEWLNAIYIKSKINDEVYSRMLFNGFLSTLKNLNSERFLIMESTRPIIFHPPNEKTETAYFKALQKFLISGEPKTDTTEEKDHLLSVFGAILERIKIGEIEAKNVREKIEPMLKENTNHLTYGEPRDELEIAKEELKRL